jgi:hypothetical protein
MTAKEIEANLALLIANFNPQEFIFDLLLAYGISKTSVTRLKKGDANFSKTEGEVLYKNKLFFAYADADLHLKLENFAQDPRILKHTPRFIIVTNNQTLLAKDLKTKANRDFALTDLPQYFDFFLPLTGAEIYKASNDNKADRDAAYKLAQLYDILVQDNPTYQQNSHQLNLFLSRLLFCFFAEDTGIFDKKSVFTENLALHTQANGADVHTFLQTLFKKLNTKDGNFPDYLNQFPYVNGGLFNAEIPSPMFSAKARQLLLSCGDLDWSEINPDIFGAMIQAVADPEERSNLGMHYTSVPNIKKLIQPLFLDALYQEFEKQAHSLAGLAKLIGRLGQIKFLDPACGSGNFLIITYKEIRLLEIEILKKMVELNTQQGLTQTLQFTNIKLSQFYGIEIKDFAHEMAILSLWLAEHQMNKVFDDMLEGYGQSKPILPLKQAGNIVCGNATRLSWETVCPKSLTDEIYVLGNPPYLGSRNQKKEQKDDMEFVFCKEYKNLDFVSAWFYLGSKYINGYNAQLAFVSTNSICQGLLVALTWPRVLKNEIEISFAYQSFKWINNARGNAGVTVIIVGLRNKNTQPKYIYTADIKKEVKNINGYLADASNTFVTSLNTPLSKFTEMNFGNMPADGGHLLFTENEKNEFLTIEPQAEKWIKELISAHEFLNGKKRYCLWLENITDVELQQLPQVCKKVDLVYKERLKSSRPKLAQIPHLFAQITQPDNKEFVLIPRHSSEEREYIPLGFFAPEYKSSDSTLIIATSQPWLFGILHSKMHMVWVNAVGGKLETRYRYSAKLCYNTFPFPPIDSKQKEIINLYVYDILDERAKYPEKTMAWLYNPDTMPASLRTAHQALDLAIDKIYTLAPFANDAERLAHLFKLYEVMTKQNTLFAKEKKVRKGGKK